MNSVNTMYSTIEVKAQGLTLDDILNKVSEYEIYKRYLGEFKIGQIYKSPFRKDKNPSFGIFVGRNSKLLFKDHGTGDCGDIIKFVSLYYNITKYDEILTMIYKDLQINNISRNKRAKKIPIPSETVIGIVRQPFVKADIDYWHQFGISLKTLHKYGVSSIQYYLCNGVVKGIYKEEQPMYAYKVYNHFKIYRPLSDKYVKWRGNLTEYDIQGYEQLPENGDLLIITKSLKDVMTLYELGYNAISPSSESTFIPDIALKQLQTRFKRLLLLFDRDVPGVHMSRKISVKKGLSCIFVHKKYKAKDISDAVQIHGKKDIKEFLKQIIK